MISMVLQEKIHMQKRWKCWGRK